MSYKLKKNAMKARVDGEMVDIGLIVGGSGGGSSDTAKRLLDSKTIGGDNPYVQSVDADGHGVKFESNDDTNKRHTEIFIENDLNYPRIFMGKANIVYDEDDDAEIYEYYDGIALTTEYGLTVSKDDDWCYYTAKGAAKAIADQNGNVIDETYVKKTELTSALSDSLDEIAATMTTFASTDYVDHKCECVTHTYESGEQVVGTWIDGKDIYRRTINVSGQTGLTYVIQSGIDTVVNSNLWISDSLLPGTDESTQGAWFPVVTRSAKELVYNSLDIVLTKDGDYRILLGDKLGSISIKGYIEYTKAGGVDGNN